MFNQISIKLKLLIAVISTIVVIAVVSEVEKIVSMEKNTNVIIEQTSDLAYKRKEQELKNYVSLAYKTVESFYARTSKDKIKDSVQADISEKSDFLFSIINAEYEKYNGVVSEFELKKRIIEIVKATRYRKSGYF